MVRRHGRRLDIVLDVAHRPDQFGHVDVDAHADEIAVTQRLNVGLGAVEALNVLLNECNRARARPAPRRVGTCNRHRATESPCLPRRRAVRARHLQASVPLSPPETLRRGRASRGGQYIPAIEMTDEVALIRAHIEALNVEFWYRVDHQNGDGVAELFCEDGVYSCPADATPAGPRSPSRT